MDLKFKTLLFPKLAPLVASTSNCIRQTLLRSGLDIIYLRTIQIQWREHISWKPQLDHSQTCGTWKSSGMQNSVFSDRIAYFVLFCPIYSTRRWHSSRCPDTLSDRTPSIHHQCCPLLFHAASQAHYHPSTWLGCFIDAYSSLRLVIWIRVRNISIWNDYVPI